MADRITAPRKIGETTEYTVNGRHFRLKRLSRNAWFLAAEDVKSRARFGTWEQIAQDIATTLETGALPPPDGPRW